MGLLLVHLGCGDADGTGWHAYAVMGVPPLGSGGIIVDVRRKLGRWVLVGAVVAAGGVVGAGPARAASVPPRVALASLSAAEVGWGNNFFGVLGDGTTQSTSTPVHATGLPGGIRQVAGGSAHTVALTAGGDVWAWGDNSFGELGDGTTTAHLTPERVAGISGAVAVAAGNGLSLVALADGTVKAWGNNNAGQVGVPAGADVLAPVTVPGVGGVVAVAAGSEHSLALRGDGTVWGWGFNRDGELGDGTQTDRSTPAPVHNLAGVKQIAAGSDEGVALTTDGAVHVWGEANEGEIGNGTTPLAQLLPATTSITSVSYISAGDLHNLAVRTDGTVWAWGWNLDRQVTDSIEIRQPLPVRVTGVPAGIVQVAAAQESSVALDSTGSAWTWGRVQGNPIVHTGVPFRAAGLVDAAAIAAGHDHYLALVKPRFTIGLNPVAGTVAAGGTVSTLVALTPGANYTGTATLAVSGLPAGITASLTSPTVGVSSPSIVTFHNPSGRAAGTFPITVTATDPNAAVPVQSASYQLTVAAAGSFSITLGLQNGTIAPGGSTTTQVFLNPFGTFTGTATLTVKGLPTGVTASFSPSTVAAHAPSTLTLTALPTCPFGTYTFSVGAVANGFGAAATYQLTVNGAPSS